MGIMKVLVICDQHDLIAPLREQLQQRVEPITQIPVNWRAIGGSVDLLAMLEQQRPDFIFCTVALATNATDESYKQYADVLKLAVRYCKGTHIPLIFLSTAAVFSGKKLSYKEDDNCEPKTAVAKFYYKQEKFIRSELKHHIILRISWIYSASGDNFLPAVIRYAAADKLISFNSAGKGCPSSVSDVVRVLIAMLLQLDAGANSWGTYHYASSDAAIGFQFVEAIVAQASQYDENIDSRQLHFEHNDAALGEFYFEPVVLDCQKLLNAFGIHQKPWRALLSDVVKEYFDEGVV